MPRKAKGPRLWLRERAGREPVWVILDRGREVSTGRPRSDTEGAERALAEYITEKYQPPKTGGKLARTRIVDVLTLYLKERAPHTARPDFLAYTAASVAEWWGSKYLSDVNQQSCSDYADWRMKQERKRRGGTISRQTARHDLKTLRTAIKYYHASKHGPLEAVPVVTLPAQTPARTDYWLTRAQVAERLRAARRLPKCRHLVRVLLIGVYTGTRPGAIKRLRWLPSTEGGWFDLDTETLHRRAQGEVESNKRAPRARIHRRLLPWLRRWYEADMTNGVKRRVKGKGGSRHKKTEPCTWVVHYGGRPVTKLRRSWRSVALAAGHRGDDGPHILRHTAATWLMQAGVDKSEAAGYLGMSEKTLEEVYGHHHPDFQREAARAAGRRRP